MRSGTLQPRFLIGAATVLTLGTLLLFRGPWAASAQSGGPQASNAMLSCETGQQAMVRHTIVNNELQVAMQCVGAGAPVPSGFVPAAYGIAPSPVYANARPLYASAPVYAAPARVVSVPRTAARVEPKKRNWGKTALVIGGSAGAGAGVGAIAGGKKGALIGAAIGGGAASLWEALKKK